LEILNAGKDRSGKTSLVYTVSLFHGPKSVFASESTSVDPSPASDRKHILTEGVLQLHPEIESGDYTFQVIVRDNLAGKKKNTAIQYMNFEIRP
jgi:hypothetical protein